MFWVFVFEWYMVVVSTARERGTIMQEGAQTYWTTAHYRGAYLLAQQQCGLTILELGV